MDGIHDLGGMHGFGKVERQENEPPFHARWEASVRSTCTASASPPSSCGDRRPSRTRSCTSISGKVTSSPPDAAGSARRRNIVRRADARLVNVARPRGQLFVCATGCCCGRTQDGCPAVPTELYHQEWERRRLRNIVHLTIAGCLGPCALANVVLLLFDGQALWFHSMDSEALVLSLYDVIEMMLDSDGCVPLPPELVRRQFTASAWQPRPDGQPVEDFRPRRIATAASVPAVCVSTAALVDDGEADA